jgi:hypothetical protein
MSEDDPQCYHDWQDAQEDFIFPLPADLSIEDSNKLASEHLEECFEIG